MSLASLITDYGTGANACCVCTNLQCYTLTPCAGQSVTNPITVKSGLINLFAVIGKIVKNVTTVSHPSMDPTICWTVTVAGPCACPVSSVDTILTVSAPYANCACCMPVIPTPLPPIPRVYPDPVRNFTKTELTDCDIQANIQFGQSYWDLTKKYRYGITTCQWNKNMLQLWVRKELSDLSFKIDPLYCVNVPTNETCAPPINSCGIQPQPWNKPGCGCQPIYAGMPCRNEPIPQDYILWSDAGILQFEYEGNLLITSNPE